LILCAADHCSCFQQIAPSTHAMYVLAFHGWGWPLPRRWHNTPMDEAKRARATAASEYLEGLCTKQQVRAPTLLAAACLLLPC
jgi:hypothetical protein